MDTTTLTRPADDASLSTTATCPDCGAATVSAQGRIACGRCRWHRAE